MANEPKRGGITTFASFYSQVEYARSMLVDASVWYAGRGHSEASRDLTKVVGDLIQWCEDNVPPDDPPPGPPRGGDRLK